MDYLTQQFLTTAKKIHDDLKRVADELHQQAKATQEKQHAPVEAQPAAPIIHELHVLDATIDRMKAKSTKEDRHEKFKDRVEIGTLGIVLAYTIITAYSWFELHIQNINQSASNNNSGATADRTLNYAKKSIDETTKNFRTDERAWIVPNFPPNEPPERYQGGFANSWMKHFQMKNEGKTVAKNVDGVTTIIVLHKDEQVRLSDCLKGSAIIEVPAFFPGVVNHSFPELDETMPDAKRLHPVNLDDPEVIKTLTERGERAAVGCGKISYSDIFSPSIRHFVTFCEVLQAHPNPVRVSPSGVFKLPRVYEECRKLNAIDEY